MEPLCGSPGHRVRVTKRRLLSQADRHSRIGGPQRIDVTQEPGFQLLARHPTQDIAPQRPGPIDREASSRDDITEAAHQNLTVLSVTVHDDSYPSAMADFVAQPSQSTWQLSQEVRLSAKRDDLVGCPRKYLRQDLVHGDFHRALFDK